MVGIEGLGIPILFILTLATPDGGSQFIFTQWTATGCVERRKNSEIIIGIVGGPRIMATKELCIIKQ